MVPTTSMYVSLKWAKCSVVDLLQNREGFGTSGLTRIQVKYG
jgi:hypothetical protein